MGGLITLLLAADPGGRSSIAASPSMASDPDALYSHAARPQSFHKPRQSSVDLMAPPTPTPINSEEWRKAVSDVKLKYANRKYRACSARCIELLADTAATETADSLYLVSLHFYAAVSLETCARPLSPSSKFRHRMLRDARHHYDQAEALIKKTEDTTIQRTRSPSAQSTASSTQAPDLCHDSYSEVSTCPSSPRSSVGSLDGVTKRSKAKPKKKVSFSGLPDLEIEIPQNLPAEPYIRPDSPTLGVEDFFTWGKPGTTPIEMAPGPEAFPLPPKTSPVKLSRLARPTSPSILVKPEPQHDQVETYSATQVESLNRMCAQISSLRSQIVFHRSTVDALLATPEEAQATPDVPPLPMQWPLSPKSSRSSSPVGTFFIQDDDNTGDHDGQVSRPHTPENHGRASPESTASFSPGPPRASSSLSMFNPLSPRSGTATSMRGRTESAMSNYSASSSTTGDNGALRERIERLRANGWRRKRFDPKKYEALRESVLDELDGRAM